MQHVVGTGVTLDCSACACNVTADCGGKVELFTDDGCTQGEIDVEADGMCYEGPAVGSGGLGGTVFNSYEYAADAPDNVDCASTGSSSATSATLANEQTICCLP